MVARSQFPKTSSISRCSPYRYRESSVSPDLSNGMWRQGISAGRNSNGTNCINTQSLQGPCSWELKFIHVGESSKISGDLQRAVGDLPYPPSSRNLSSNFRTSKRSRSSFCILHLLSRSEYRLPRLRLL